MLQEQDYQWARAYLDMDETILWRGRPEKLHLLDRMDLYLVPFSILWCGFAIYWEYTVNRSHGPAVFMLFGGAFVLFGLFMVFGRFVYKGMVLKSSAYVITNKNVLIKQKEEIKVLKKQALPALTIRKHHDGTGTIELEHTSLFSRKPGYGYRYGTDMRSICGIRDEIHGIREPERVLRYLQEFDQ